jgi:hypothetical protein
VLVALLTRAAVSVSAQATEAEFDEDRYEAYIEWVSNDLIESKS